MQKLRREYKACARRDIRSNFQTYEKISFSEGRNMANIVNLFGYHTITFDAQGGEPVKPIHKRRSQLVIMPKAVRAGYIFGGWFFDKECTRPALISTMPRENVKVYARWNVILPFTEEEKKKPQFFLPAEATSVPHPKSFVKQLKEGSNANKTTFTGLCGYLLGYKGVRVRYKRREALFRFGKTELVRVTVNGNALRIFYALDPDGFEPRTYHHRRTEKKWAEATPLQLTVRSKRSRKYAQMFAEKVVEKFGLQPRRNYKFLDYQTYVLALGGNALTKAGQSALIAERINVQDTDVLSDADARAMQEVKKVPPAEGDEKIVTVATTTLSENFPDGVRVNLAVLKRKKLIAEDATGFRLVGKGTMERSLIVTANAFNLSALKMILLAGGRAIVLKEDDALANPAQ